MATARVTSRAWPRSWTTWPTWASPPCGCCRSIPRRARTTATTSPTTRASSPSTARCATSSCSSAKPTPAAYGSSPSWSAITPPTSIRGSSARAARRRAAPIATGMSGRTTPTSTKTPGSSSRTSRLQTGHGIRSPTPTTGTASTHTNRTSTSRTLASAPRCSRLSTSGSKWAWTACALMPSRTSTKRRGPTARTCRARMSS